MADRDDIPAASANAPSPPLPRRRRRRLRAVAVIAGVLLALAIAPIIGAPTLLSAGVGVALIERVASNERTRIEIGDLDLQWSGAQRIEALEVRDAAGGYATNLDLALDGALWSWATGSRDFGPISSRTPLSRLAPRSRSRRSSRSGRSFASRPKTASISARRGRRSFSALNS